MSVKAILVFCAQALLIQTAFSQCVSSGNYGAGLAGYGWGAPALVSPIASSGLACGAGQGNGLGYGAGISYGAGLGCGAGLSNIAIEAIPTSGGGLPVSSISAIAPSGLSVTSENVYEGALSVAGELPFVSAVALEGVLPSVGAGAVSYSCGNGVTAIESIAPFGASYGPAAAPGIAAIAPAAAASGLTYGSLAGRGCGCGLY